MRARGSWVSINGIYSRTAIFYYKIVRNAQKKEKKKGLFCPRLYVFGLIEKLWTTLAIVRYEVIREVVCKQNQLLIIKIRLINMLAE